MVDSAIVILDWGESSLEFSAQRNLEMLKSKIKNLPQRPGVYIFKNEEGDVIYIGKAKNLKARVGSYFHKSLDKGSKTQILVDNIHEIEIIEVISEIEALILEASLIQKHQPRYNILLKDDKSFLYIEICDDFVEIDGKEVNLPTVKVSRKSDLKEESRYFGPFPSSRSTRFVFRALRRHFPYRDCSKNKFNRYKKLDRPCLYGKIKLCPAPCVSAVTPKEYRKSISAISAFLEGEASLVMEDLERKMEKYSREQDYERAADYRDRLEKFKYIRKKKVPAYLYTQNPSLSEDIAQEALQELKELLPMLKDKPHRIECYDISDLSGKDAVGSMTVAINGKLERSKYRRFKIKSVKGADDFAKMAEVLERRTARMKENSLGWEKPDMIVLDGGKGQLSSVREVFDKFEVNDIPIIGLAKKEEEIVYFWDGSYRKIALQESFDQGLNLLIKLRDEAHRFAQAYHHKLRLKSLLE